MPFLPIKIDRNVWKMKSADLVLPIYSFFFFLSFSRFNKRCSSTASFWKMCTIQGREGPRRGLAIGSTGTFPGGLAADLARCPVFLLLLLLFFLLLLLLFCLPNVPKWSFPIVVFPNKSIINHKSVSLDWQRALHVCSLPPSKVDARDSRKERKQPEETIKCSEITNLFRASSAGQFHL